MSTTPNRMQLHWVEVQPFLKRIWPKLTDVDLEEIDGEFDRLIQKIKQLYGGPEEIMQEAPIKSKIQRYLNELEQKTTLS